MKTKIQQSNEEINSIGGISLIGGLLNNLKNMKKVDSMQMAKVKTGRISHSEILKSTAALFAIGKNDYADIELFHHDPFFLDCLQLSQGASEETLRQCLDILAQEPKLLDFVLQSNVEMLKRVTDFGTEQTKYGEYIPLDIDVSPLDNSGSSKEEVSWTYKNHDGYAPIFAYLGTHGYMINCELRPGSQHSNKNALEFIHKTLDILEQLGVDLLINDIEVNTFWTNLPEEAETVIQLYHAHGTSEQFHSELKTDLDFERLLSGKFATNSLLLLLAMLAFNVLRILGQAALQMKNALPRKFKVQRRRLRSVIQDLIYIACKRVRHAGSIFLKFGRHCPWFEVFRQLHIKFC